MVITGLNEMSTVQCTLFRLLNAIVRSRVDKKKYQTFLKIHNKYRFIKTKPVQYS